MININFTCLLQSVILHSQPLDNKKITIIHTINAICVFTGW